MADGSSEDGARGRRARPGGKQASMADVAARAGVSMITVSRALHQPERVTVATRARIEAAMAEVGYVPNLVAGGLASAQTRLVAAIVPYIQHGVFADAVQGLSDRLDRHGYCVLLGNSGGMPETEESIVRMLLGHRPAGLVIQGANHAQSTRDLLRRANIPLVEMGTLPPEPIDMAVGYSNREAGRAIAAHLVALGRRRIGFVVSDPETNDRHAQRLEGFREALGEAGLTVEARLVVQEHYGLPEGRTALAALLARDPRLDALCCGSDLWAAGAIFDCARRGIAVPDDLAVTGFNDQEIAAETIPPITTIHVRRYEIGATAGDMILARLAGEGPGERVVDVGFELVRRGSA